MLIPVLDDDKHYFVGDAEVDKLIRRGEGWLPAHPERETIVNRYLNDPAFQSAAFKAIVKQIYNEIRRGSTRPPPTSGDTR